MLHSHILFFISKQWRYSKKL